MNNVTIENVQATAIQSVSNPSPSRFKIKEEAVKPKQGFTWHEWEKRADSATSDKQKFKLWIEAVTESEGLYGSWQDSLLSVLQRIYSHFYYVETSGVSATKKAAVESAESALGDDLFSSKDGYANKLVKIAFKQYLSAQDDKLVRSYQKRVSTYASAIRNAYAEGQTIEGKTDDKGRLLPNYFAEVVKSLGGIASFSRKSVKQLLAEEERDAKLAEVGFESVEAWNISKAKDAMISGSFTDHENQYAAAFGIEVSLPCLELDTELADTVDVALNEVAVLIVTNVDGVKIVRSVIKGQDEAPIIEGVLAREHQRLEAKLEAAIEREKVKRTPNDYKGKIPKQYVNGIQFSNRDVETLEKLKFKALQAGFDEVDKFLVAMLDSVCEAAVRHEETIDDATAEREMKKIAESQRQRKQPRKDSSQRTETS
jgi:hypothetical protein